MSPGEFLKHYERQTNTHLFANVAPLIAQDVVFWFGDGSHVGIGAIQKAFESTWAVIKDEVYELRDTICLAADVGVAAYTYTYHWKGLIDGRMLEGVGRGTSVVRKSGESWQIVHEHLSKFPTKQ